MSFFDFEFGVSFFDFDFNFGGRNVVVKQNIKNQKNFFPKYIPPVL